MKKVFDLSEINKDYIVRRLNESDICAILGLYKSNPMYFEKMHSAVSYQNVVDDMSALPPNISLDDKYYIGFYNKNELVAIMDFINGYPTDETAFIGLFITDARFQRTGVGSDIISKLTDFCVKTGYKSMELGYVKENMQSSNFWKKNGFSPTGKENVHEHYIIVYAIKKL